MRVLVLLLVALFPVLSAMADDSLWLSIREAGNAGTDQARLDMLGQLRARGDLDEAVAANLDKLIAEIERYIASPRLDYFGNQVLKTGAYDFGIASDSPLQPIALLYQARMLAWVTMEYGGYWSKPEERRKQFDTIRPMFEQLRDCFPENGIVGMYLGEAVPPDKTFASFNGAPAWAVHQREAIQRLADIIHWWIDNRMQANGEFGGGWGDDCEMWRWWVPVLIGFDDPEIAAAQARFSRAIFDQPHLAGGYTSRMSDVEHTAEDSADALTPMMHLESDNPVWSQRALRLAQLMRESWTGVNERGFLQFKSTYFTSDKVDGDARRACDSVYHPRAVQPALLYWQRTGDPDLGRLFSDWMSTWADAAARAERGKPAGVIPSAIHWPDGRIGGLGAQWWDPENHNADPLYVWPSAMGQMTNTLLLAYYMTHEDRFLEPLLSMARVRLDFANAPVENPEPGSAQWCGRRIRLIDVAMKYKLLYGKPDFDRLLDAEPTPFAAFRFGGDRVPLAKALAETARALQINFAGYTSEVRYTDRVLRFPHMFSPNGMRGDGSADIPIPDTQLLYATATGDPGDGIYFPLNAVRWLTPPRDIAALVVEANTRRFVAEVVNFDERPRGMGTELYLLEPGSYDWRAGGENGRIEATGKRARIEFTAAPRAALTIDVSRVDERASLALDEFRVRDPFILPCATEGLYYLFGTGVAKYGWGRGIPVYTSRDLRNWSGPRAAFVPPSDFPTVNLWAPEVHAYKGKYYMFATLKLDGKPRGTHILVADEPDGPYTMRNKVSATPPDWYCLDGTLFIDDAGAPWMVFCHEWVQIGDGEICAMRLNEDLSAPVGEPVTLLKASAVPWVTSEDVKAAIADAAEKGPEKPGKGLVTDGPFLHRTSSGALLMIWSTFGKGGYQTVVARSESGEIAGPWTQDPEPLFSDDGGHAMVFRAFGGRLMLTLHRPNVRPNERARVFELDEVGDRLVVRAIDNPAT
jgi:hypothetical protein